jgi:hypothetical protein
MKSTVVCGLIHENHCQLSPSADMSHLFHVSAGYASRILSLKKPFSKNEDQPFLKNIYFRQEVSCGNCTTSWWLTGRTRSHGILVRAGRGIHESMMDPTKPSVCDFDMLVCLKIIHDGSVWKIPVGKFASGVVDHFAGGCMGETALAIISLRVWRYKKAEFAVYCRFHSRAIFSWHFKGVFMVEHGGQKRLQSGRNKNFSCLFCLFTQIQTSILL